jgi:hypothetical protein
MTNVIGAFRWMMFVGIAKSQLGADAEAVVWLRRSIDANRNMPTHISASPFGHPGQAHALIEALAPGQISRVVAR